MERRAVNADSFIRALPFSAVRKLAQLLDPDKFWEGLLECIPQNPGSRNFEPRYSAMHARLFAERHKKYDGSATRSILDDWGTQNATIQNLIDALSNAKLYAAANYLSVEVLNGSPVPRNSNNNKAYRNVSNLESIDPDHFNKTEMYKRQSKAKEQDIVQADVSNQIHFKSDDERFVNTSQSNTCIKRDVCYSSLMLQSPPKATISHSSSGNISDKVCAADLYLLPSEEAGRQVIENDETCVLSAGCGQSSQLDLDNLQIQDKTQCISYSTLSKITDNFNDLEINAGGRLIGSGGFGKVFLGRFQNNMLVAVKVLKETAENMVKQFKTELEVLSNYRHENLLPLLGYSCENCLCLVYDYMPNGSLEDRLACKNGTQPLNIPTRLQIAVGTAHGINYLNESGTVHRDIKSANVLLDDGFVAKVGDFATARAAPLGLSSTLCQTSIVIGTSAYLAPEAHLGDVSAKLDSYGFGVVLLELLTCLPAFDSTREERDLKTYIEENFEDIMDVVDVPEAWTKNIAHKLNDISAKCLEDRKKKRCTVGQILPDLEALCQEGTHVNFT